jgi:hypothetical protein
MKKDNPSVSEVLDLLSKIVSATSRKCPVCGMLVGYSDGRLVRHLDPIFDNENKLIKFKKCMGSGHLIAK